jgi:hypothetical protein
VMFQAAHVDELGHHETKYEGTTRRRESACITVKE